MPARERANQKLKILYIMKILMERTDEEHAITLKEIEKELLAYGINAERKSIYSDMETLRSFGLDIEGNQKDRTFYYRLLSRDFELPELKLLVDSIQASRFITEKKTKELIQKVERYASVYQAQHLHRQMFVSDKIKSSNESIYYSVDTIYSAIDNNQKISFQYYSYDENRKKVLAHDGLVYKVSPWMMCWNEEKYYLIGFDENPDNPKIKYFRVDKMLRVNLVEEPRLGEKEYLKIDMKTFNNRHFSMFGGEKKRVELLCPNHMANVIFDRFGTEIKALKVDEGHFRTSVEVDVSDLFFGWIMALDSVKILGPEDVVEKLKKMIERQMNLYS